MNQTARKLILLAVALVTMLTLAVGTMPTKAQKVTVTWFVGLGTGTDKAQIDPENALVDKFNKSQDAIELKINIAASNQVAPDALSTLIASGNAPDIVGPVGVAGSNSFHDEWLDLKPLVDKTKYNLAQFPENVVNIYLEGGGLYGLPFAVYPGLLYYNRDLFDEAGLAYPPKNFGDKYKLDGKDVDWDYDTITTIAQRLTVDANGNDATSDKFDPTKIVQFGFDHQWDTIRSDFQTFGGAPVVDPATGKVVIAPQWRAQAQWQWNALWKYHFMPDNAYINSDLLKPSAFASGKVAMTRVMLWYTCCLGDLKANWDLAPVPMYQGKYYAPADADTFRVDKNTKNPDATFTVLQYMLGDGALDLLTVYGAFPARPDLQAQFLKAKADQYKSVTNWDIVKPSFDYGTVPHHESYYPNFNKGQQRFQDFATWMRGDKAATGDVNAELDKLEADLNAIVSQAPATAAAK
jgi:multiple sugar transport system substrate-binding protein